MIHILDAAHYLVLLSYEKEYSLTPLKLQKLLYLAQGWSCVWDKTLLFSGEFEPWAYGPANVEVYEEFKKYGREEIPKEEGYDHIIDKSAKETLKAIWRIYGKMSAHTLVELTCSQTPWIDAHKKQETISNESIQRYFQAVY